MKKFFLFLLLLILVLIGIILFNTFRFKSRQPGVLGERKQYSVDTAAIGNLRKTLSIRTISYDDPSLIDYSAFDSLYDFLEKAYPQVWSSMQVDRINSHSLLLHWKGNSTGKSPVILYAHADVVPAGDSLATGWEVPPFDGKADDRFIYGRGAIDDKGSLVSVFEAATRMISKGRSPSKDIYIAIGHDEERGGREGAAEIAKNLESKGVKAEFLLDEGGLIAVDMVPFVTPPVALVATAEKGYMTLRLEVKGKGGHSSFPQKETPADILATAITRLRDKPFEKTLTQPLSEFIDHCGPEMRMPFRALFANRWLFAPVILNEYEKIPGANAMIRTTGVTTMISGGEKENAVPQNVHALVNFRILPGENSNDVRAKVKEIIGDARVTISVVGEITEPSGITPASSAGFRTVSQAIHEVFPDIVVAPTLLVGATDSKHFSRVTSQVIRFLPVRMNDEILETFHGLNERTGINDFMESIAFYERVMELL